jgi:hypothetical protein
MISNTYNIMEEKKKTKKQKNKHDVSKTKNVHSKKKI